MKKITAIGMLALLGSAAADADLKEQAAYNQAVLNHAACTESAAVEMAKKDGEAYDLARHALIACRAEEAEIAKHVSREDMQAILGKVLWLRRRTILDQRAGPPPPRMYCADCGTMRRWDDQLQMWRMPGR